jgi:hypothetical protein
MYEEIVNAHQMNLKVNERTIEHRLSWVEISKIERLERALSTARGKLSTLNLSAKVN